MRKPAKDIIPGESIVCPQDGYTYVVEMIVESPFGLEFIFAEPNGGSLIGWRTSFNEPVTLG